MSTVDDVRLEAFQYFITTSPTAAPPYVSSDYIPLVRAGKTFKVPANQFAPIEPPISAPPSATVGKTAVDGTASTFMTSDSAPPLAPYVALLDTADQTLSGGANVASHNLGTVTTGTVTVDCGQCPLQYLINGGAFAIAAPAADGSTIILITNNSSAGAISFTGFAEGSNTGDALNTTNTDKFSIFFWRINGTAGYRVAAHQ